MSENTTTNAAGQPTMTERLAEIRARAEAATPGPWTWDRAEPKRPHAFTKDPTCGRALFDELVSGGAWVLTSTDYVAWCEDPPSYVTLSGMCATEANAAFLAHSRTDIPWLLARIEALQDAAVEGSGRLNADGSPVDFWCRFCDQRAPTPDAIVHRERCAMTGAKHGDD